MSNTTSKSVESLAVAYKENSHIQRGDGVKLLSLLKLQGNMKVLDLGCGTGQLSCIIADQLGDGGSVVAIDPDKARLKIAKEAYSSVKNLVFQDGEAESIPGCDYDVVFSNYVFHWIQDKEKAFHSVYRSLKPSGVFAGSFITTMLKSALDYINLMEPNHLHRFQNAVSFKTSDEIQRIASICGFSVQYKEVGDIICHYTDFDDFMHNLYAGFHGLVDPKLMDAKKLQELRQSVGSRELEVPLINRTYFVFKKD